jgi:hypothetical protein
MKRLMIESDEVFEPIMISSTERSFFTCDDIFVQYISCCHRNESYPRHNLEKH